MRYIHAILILCSLSGPVIATETNNLRQCRAISEAAARLLCYDQLADAAAAIDHTKADSIGQHRVAPATRATTNEAGRRDEALFGTAGETIASTITDLTVQVSAVSQDQHQKLMLTMNNGQRWQQLDQGFLKISIGDQCVIRSAIFGSYTMKCQQGRKAVRVKRIQ